MSTRHAFWGSIGLIILTGILIHRGSLLGTTGELLRGVFGAVVLVFLPGYWVVGALFAPEQPEKTEHLILSIGCSLALVPLVVFFVNLTGISITPWMVLGVVSLIIIGSQFWISRHSSLPVA